MFDLPKHFHNCCKVQREKETSFLSTTRIYSQRLIKVYTCPKCASKKMVTLFTDRTDEVSYNLFEKTKEVNKLLQDYLPEKIEKEEYKQPKFISNTSFNFRHYDTRKPRCGKEKFQNQVECYADGTPAKIFDVELGIEKFRHKTDLQKIS